MRDLLWWLRWAAESGKQYGRRMRRTEIALFPLTESPKNSVSVREAKLLKASEIRFGCGGGGGREFISWEIVDHPAHPSSPAHTAKTTWSTTPNCLHGSNLRLCIKGDLYLGQRLRVNTLVKRSCHNQVLHNLLLGNNYSSLCIWWLKADSN